MPLDNENLPFFNKPTKCKPRTSNFYSISTEFVLKQLDNELSFSGNRKHEFIVMLPDLCALNPSRHIVNANHHK